MEEALSGMAEQLQEPHHSQPGYSDAATVHGT